MDKLRLAFAMLVVSVLLPAGAGAWVVSYGQRRGQNGYVDFQGPAVVLDASGDVYARAVDNPTGFLIVRF